MAKTYTKTQVEATEAMLLIFKGGQNFGERQACERPQLLHRFHEDPSSSYPK